MQEIYFEAFSTSAGVQTVQDCLALWVNILQPYGAAFRVSGDTPSGDVELDWEGFQSGSWHDAYSKAGQIFFESKAVGVSGGCSTKCDFEHISTVFPGNSVDRGQLIETFKSCATTFNSDLAFLFGENTLSKDYFNISYGVNEEGLLVKAGLRDVYWLNYYGKPFLDVITTETLAGTSAFDYAELEEGVFLQISDAIDEALDRRLIIRRQIGEEFFVPKNVARKTRDRVGFFGLAKHLLELRVSPKDTEVAKIPPKFD